MYRRWKKRRYHNNQPNILEMLVEIIASLIFLLGKLIYKLIQSLFKRSFRIPNGFYTIKNNQPTNLSNLGSTQNIETPTTLDGTYLPEKQTSSNNEGGRYNLKESPLSAAEDNFLTVLKQVVNDKYTIQTQVHLSSLVKPKDSNAHYINYRDFNKVNVRSIDFVLFDKNYKPYLCIELDDRSHLRLDRIKRDVFVDAVMKNVGLRIVHIRASYSYSPKYLSEVLGLEKV